MRYCKNTKVMEKSTLFRISTHKRTTRKGTALTYQVVAINGEKRVMLGNFVITPRKC